MSSGHGYADAPELAPQQFPEVVHQTHPQTGYVEQHTQANEAGRKPEVYSPFTENVTPAGTYSHPGSPSQPEPEGKKSRKGVICGVSTLVFLLSCIIGLLAAAVVGLAAGTGVEAHRASVAESSLASLSAVMATATATPTVSSNGTATTGSPAATTTAWNELDMGCSNNPEGVTGTTYSSFQFLGDITFTIFCNKDAPGNPYLSLFTSDFETCMDACGAYSIYMPNTFNNSIDSNHTTCGGVSFIPLWTVKAQAQNGTAPGNCYLKPAGQTVTGLNPPTIGTECHAAIIRGA